MVALSISSLVLNLPKPPLWSILCFSENMVRIFWILAVLGPVVLAQAQLVLYNSTAAINATAQISAACQEALITGISCPASLFTFAGTGLVLDTDNSTIGDICGVSCTSSIAAYHHGIATALPRHVQTIRSPGPVHQQRGREILSGRTSTRRVW